MRHVLRARVFWVLEDEIMFLLLFTCCKVVQQLIVLMANDKFHGFFFKNTSCKKKKRTLMFFSVFSEYKIAINQIESKCEHFLPYVKDWLK